MTERDEIISRIKMIQQNLASKFGVSRVGIFGSVARGEATINSDVDLIIEFDPARPADFFILSALADVLKATLGKEVDIITKQAIAKKTRLRARIEKETLYV